MKWTAAQAVVEAMRRETQLYLPPLTTRRGFSSTRVEHLLNRLVAAMPLEECYLEVGTLEGRTLEAAAAGNGHHRLYGCDPEDKYGAEPSPFADNVRFIREPWNMVLARVDRPIGLAFYDADHSTEETALFLESVRPRLAREAVLVLDDWDRATVRRAAFGTAEIDPRWQLLREMPEYGDGLTCQPNWFGFFFGVSVWGWKR